jgi:predicted CopG family antitoxin
MQQLPWKVGMESVITAAERRKRLKLKRIVISEHNYLALKRLGQAGDSFNHVVSKLLRIERIYQEMKKQQEQQQESDDSSVLPSLSNPSAMFGEQNT